MKKLITIFLPIATSLVLTGCKPVELPAQLVTDARLCVKDVRDTEIEYQKTEQIKAQKTVKVLKYMTEANMLISEAFAALKEVALRVDKDAHGEEYTDSLLACGNSIVAYLKTTGQISSNRHGTSRSALKVAGLIGAIGAGGWAIDKALSPAFQAAGAGQSGDSFSVYNSRIVSKSNNDSVGSSASASGDGLGLGNTYNLGNGQGVGGIQPRTSPVNQSSDLNFNPASNSGTNEPINPSEGASIQPVEMPVE